jgi:hypothetical protein
MFSLSHFYKNSGTLYESSPTTDRTARYIHQVIDFVFQGKVDDALWDLTEYLLQEVAPGKIKRIIQDWCAANEYDAGEAGSSLKDVQSFIVHTMDEIHGGKTDDALDDFIILLLENFSPSLMISIIDKMALSFNDITQEDLEGIKVKAGLIDKVTRPVATDDHSVFDPDQEISMDRELKEPGNFDFPVHRKNGILLARVIARSKDGKLLLIKYKDYDDGYPEEETTYALIPASKTRPTSEKNVIRHEGGNDFDGYAVVDDTGHIAHWETYDKASEDLMMNAAHRGLLQFGNKNKGAFLGFKASTADGTYKGYKD